MEEELENIRKLEELIGKDPNNIPPTKKILEMIEKSDFSEEVKQNLREIFSRGSPKVFGSHGTLLSVIFVAIIVLIILFFGYKLYKSIKDKELKKVEKKKAKEMKKKK